MQPAFFRHLLCLGFLLFVTACAASQPDSKSVSDAAAATVAAIRAAGSSVPASSAATREVVTTKVIDVTRIVEITRVVDVTRIVQVTPPPGATGSADAATNAASVAMPTVDTAGTAQVAGWKVSELAKGNAAIPYDAGEAGKVSVVHYNVHSKNNRVVYVVVRNNTDSPVTSVDVSGVVRTAEGAMLGVGSGVSFEPQYVESGAISFGAIVFNLDLPKDAKYEFDAEARELSLGNTEQGDLQVLEFTFAEASANSFGQGRVYGLLKNTGGKTVTGPIKVNLYCFERDGSYSNWSAFPPKDNADPDQTIPFEVTLYSACPTYLIMASGFAW